MSRAFVKEGDGALDPLPDLPLSPHPNYVTPRGLAALQMRLSELQTTLQSLRARPDRLDKLPEAATERLQLEKGDVDIARSMTPTDFEGMAGNADVVTQNDVGGQVYYLSFNQKNENYKNAKFLDAMRWSVDYQGMADTIMLFAALGWETANAFHETLGAGGTLGRETRAEVVLIPRLRTALRRLNPGLTNAALDLAVEELALELLVLPDVGRRHPRDALGHEQDAEAPVVDAAVVGDDLQLVGAAVVQGLDENGRDAAETETTDGERHARFDARDRVDSG